MKYIYPLILLLILCSCTTKKEIPKKIRHDFSNEEQAIITTAKKVIEDTYFTTLITIDAKGQPRARVMEPFAPDDNFIIWMATNPKSRKVTQLKNNATATLHYYDKANFSYVSLMGKAFLIDDEALKANKFKRGWEQFYNNQKEDYLLIQFIPESLELISIPNNFTGDSITWKPHRVLLRY